MNIPRPITTEYDEHRETTRALFEDQTRGEYYMRGGIAWPSLVPDKDGREMMQGYAVLCGVNVRTDKVIVWASLPFSSIITTVTGTTVDAVSLGPWLNRQWSEWFARSYYCCDKSESCQTFRRQIEREDSIMPKPRLWPMLWNDEKAAESIFWQAAHEKRLGMDESFASDVSHVPMGKYCPARHALVCALMGIHKRPWRDPGPKPFEFDKG